MSNENSVDYEAVLADLIIRRDQLNTAIAAIESIVGVVGASPSGAASGGASANIKPDEFFGMTIVDAAKKYLAMKKRPQTSQDITEKLREGGYLFTSENPITTVASILNRDDTKGGEIVRVSKGLWGLASWYPNRPRKKRQNGEAEIEAEGTEEQTKTDEGNATDLA